MNEIIQYSLTFSGIYHNFYYDPLKQILYVSCNENGLVIYEIKYKNLEINVIKYLKIKNEIQAL